MNSKQRRKILRKHKEAITVLRVTRRINDQTDLGIPDQVLAYDLDWQQSKWGKRWQKEMQSKLQKM